jgi:hypothetical protein
LIEKPSAHRKSSRRISGQSESPPLRSGEVFQQTARKQTARWTNFFSGWASEQRRKALDRKGLRPTAIYLGRSSSVF